jgi:sugar phosphate isomerase/epimerase
MKLGVFDPVFADLGLEEMLDRVVALGLQAVEVGTGNYPGNAHCRPDELLADASRRAAFASAFSRRGLAISALSCQGNPLHPRPEVARASHETYVKTLALAAQLGVECVVVFSGCPGDAEQAAHPNWVIMAWPPENQEVLAWQWREKVTPYWREAIALARRHGIKKVAFEMHGGAVVYNPRTLLLLRQAVGEAVGANLDPSHLFWQGIDVVAAVKRLGAEGAIFHVHAKDNALDEQNKAVNGVLEPQPLSQLANRSWVGRSVGFGHDELTWKRIVSALRLAGYEGVLSIEHEDPLASVDEGLRHSIAFLQRCLLSEPPARPWW